MAQPAKGGGVADDEQHLLHPMCRHDAVDVPDGRRVGSGLSTGQKSRCYGEEV